MDRDTVEALRLQVLANGWTPIPNRDKRTFFKDWPHVAVDEAEIRSWSRRFRRDLATGLRIENGLGVIDLDVDHPVVDKLVNKMFDLIPELEDERYPLLVRRGKGRKEAWFFRVAEPFSRIFTRRWLAPGADPDADGAHCVEIFGGASARQFGAFGAHTRLDDGTVSVSYVWDGRSPADTRQSELVTISKARLHGLVDAFEVILEAEGFTPVKRSTKGESDAVRIYDIADGVRFHTPDGRDLSLPELREVAADEDHLRCSPWPWMPGETSRNTSRCLVSLNRSGQLCIWDSATGNTHMEVAFAPADHAAILNRVAERLRELDEKTRYRIDRNDDAYTASVKLLATRAFCPNQVKGVVPIWATSLDDGVVMSAFRTEMLPNAQEEIGPRGGRKLLHPVDIWASSDKRVTVQGLRMRPDKERPLYNDAGGLWVNTYAPPLHDAEGGSPDVGVRFLAHLVPDADERRWYTQWLAHKRRYPGIPGPAVIMVARDFGTGRGTHAVMLAKLFGSRYVKTVPFSMIAGSTYQSQYTDWGASALIAVVNESADTAGAGVYSGKRNTYEHLKELVDPRPIEKQFVSKGAHFTAISFTSFLIFTNHVDALPIPETDRRFAVISNGDRGTPEMWAELNAWMDSDANIAAFAAWLDDVDLEGYSPFLAPAMTRAKEDMVEASKTDLDRGMALAMANLNGEVFCVEQVVALMRKAATVHGLDYPEQWAPMAKRAARNLSYRVGVRNGQNWHPMFEGRRYAVYARSRSAANRWTAADPDALTVEVMKSGSPADSGIGAVAAGIFRSAEDRS